jgi:hypothetical protein
MYLPLGTTTPIFLGGVIRWIADRLRGVSASESETETSSGVLLSSGYIAGGTLVGLILAFFVFLGDAFNKALDLNKFLPEPYTVKEATGPKIVALVMFGILALILLAIGTRKSPEVENGPPQLPVDRQDE